MMNVLLLLGCRLDRSQAWFGFVKFLYFHELTLHKIRNGLAFWKVAETITEICSQLNEL